MVAMRKREQPRPACNRELWICHPEPLLAKDLRKNTWVFYAHSSFLAKILGENQKAALKSRTSCGDPSPKAAQDDRPLFGVFGLMESIIPAATVCTSTFVSPPAKNLILLFMARCYYPTPT